MNENQKIEIIRIDTKIGIIDVFIEDGKAIRLSLVSDSNYKDEHYSKNHHIYSKLLQYFSGESHVIDIPFSITGTEFEMKVLRTISMIPYGETWSYKQLAIASGYPKAIRAVGSVCRKNKLPLIIPCHRVIRSDGSYGQYVFGSELKKQLIEFERMHKTN